MIVGFGSPYIKGFNNLRQALHRRNLAVERQKKQIEMLPQREYID